MSSTSDTADAIAEAVAPILADINTSGSGVPEAIVDGLATALMTTRVEGHLIDPDLTPEQLAVAQANLEGHWPNRDAGELLRDVARLLEQRADVLDPPSPEN